MTEHDNPPSALASFIFLAGVCALGYFAYTFFFPSDRQRVRACVAGMTEAARRTSFYGEFKSQLNAVDAADHVVIENETRRPLGGYAQLTLNYSIDGKPSTIICGDL